MAKPRKPKNNNEDQKPDNSIVVVQHQKLCLSIDMENRRIYGYTELKVLVPESGVVGLHADNMIIDSVLVDGEKAEYDYFPHYQFVDDERRYSSVSSTTSASDAACSSYISSLDKELAPNLLILCCKEVKAASSDKAMETNVDTNAENMETNAENGPQSSSETKQNVKVIRIDYWIEKAETGIHFENNVLHTDNQIRRAHCWFPCVDDSLQRCCFDMEFTVAQNLVAVSNGTLLYQVLSKDDPPRKTFVYQLSVPVTAGWISLVIAQFEILPDSHSGIISHLCLSSDFSKLRNTVAFFHSAFSHYEDYLNAPFPFGSYKQVFIAPEMAISSLSVGASMSIFSSRVLFDEKVIDQTIDTRIKLAYALAKQWFGVYIISDGPSDEWLLDGLAGFLTDTFIKRFLGNNEARYRRYKANLAVCKADVSGACTLSSHASTDLYGTECMGLYGKVRSWKSVAILQMLEKQMGPESFRKILQVIILRAQDTSRSLRTLSTKEFRHLSNKVGNLERPFLKEFFPRWVGSCGCPVLRLGLSYNKRKNQIELAVLRGCTSTQDSPTLDSNGNPDTEAREGDVGWPGMMSIRVYELDGMYDHPILPMAGEDLQLLEIQCHSRLAAKRLQKPKKGSKPDGSDDNGDILTTDLRPNAESPLLWLRADPEMEYLAEIHFNQPIQMWINQLEKDKDVVAQAQAIATLESLPQLSFSVVNALYNFLSDSKAFWRVRVEAAFALAHTASEDTDWAGLLHLVKFYKSRRFDENMGLPRPNDFHDFPEYFVLEAIPHAIAMVRAADKKSPREAVEFVLQLLKYNDNNGNPYSDVYWLAALVHSIGELEFGQQVSAYKLFSRVHT
ncbi:Transcription initiation factor tfiid subunit [Thalictrum thalictroides]|uniref:Transcription initiation factor TFIID subunit 2 n=1 Tax=Thalictrum thalictroides TaxID=46969 RepID=A0A7J6X8R8_THATH|nr:Transcription initiation factor tfiid subunit [Thalictrum thalictroides]